MECHKLLYFVLTFLCLLLPISHAKFYKSNITDLSACDVIYTRNLTEYEAFYPLPEPTITELLVDFHFYTLAVSDAHILLAPGNTVKRGDPVYEIVIGAGGNTFSDIRRKEKGDVRATVRQKGILSAVDAVGFWVHIYKNGSINLGQEGQQLPFLTYVDKQLIFVKVFSFSSWQNVDVKWYVNCKREEDKAQNRIVTYEERLRKDILTSTQSHDKEIYVYMEMISKFISLDAKTSIMNYKASATMMWSFTPAQWDPKKYGGIKKVAFQHDELWKPQLVISNAIDREHMQPFGNNLLIAHYKNGISWISAIDISIYCDMNGITNWPNDIHTCTINFNTWHAHNDLVRFRFQGATEKLKYNSEWDIIEIIGQSYEYPQSNGTPEEFLKRPTALEIRMKIQRKPGIYNLSFYAPLYVISTLMLINFWCSPFDYSKLTIVSVQFLITIFTAIGLLDVLPVHQEQIPLFVYYYHGFLIANVINLIIAIIVLNISRRKHQYEPPHVVGRLIKSYIVEKLLFLPEFMPRVASSYPVAIETIRRKSRVQDVWIRLGLIIDRLGFLTFFVFALCMLCLL